MFPFTRTRLSSVARATVSSVALVRLSSVERAGLSPVAAQGYFPLITGTVVQSLGSQSRFFLLDFIVEARNSF